MLKLWGNLLFAMNNSLLADYKHKKNYKGKGGGGA